MSTAREINTKISSIKNTQKITHAMELVAASKMRKAQERITISPPYTKKNQSEYFDNAIFSFQSMSCEIN